MDDWRVVSQKGRQAMARNSNGGQPSTLARVLISLLGIILIIMAIGNLMLFIFGETAVAEVHTRRTGGERYNAVNDRRYSWAVDYTFMAEDGKSYSGHLTKLGSATGVDVSRRIYYFPFAPYFNTTEDTGEPNLGQLFMVAVGVFLLMVMNRKKWQSSAADGGSLNIWPGDDSASRDATRPMNRVEGTMSKFCTFCGASLVDGARFCPNCGTALGQEASQQPTPVSAYSAAPSLIGWTTRHQDPVVLARAAKNKRIALGFTLFLVIAFPAGFALASLFGESLPMDQALLIGIGLGLLMLVIGLVRLAGMKAGTWDGTVTDKQQKQKMDNSQEDSVVRHNMIYTIVVTETSGKTHMLKYTDNRAMYDYIHVGDRVRCHEAFGTYEKYDKSRDSLIYCNVCGKQNDISADQCRSCHLPLFK
jgi:ribosomal protein L40E